MLAAVLLSPVIAAAAPVPMKDGFPVTRSDALYPLDKIKRGQRGVGYTVFSGAQAEPFEFEVLGVLKGMLGPGKDVILARLEGKQIEFTGVISGMSGSPTYIDGKLVGAVAYRFGVFSKEPIAGITPIRSMLQVYDQDTEVAPLASYGGPRGQAVSVDQFRDPANLPAITLPPQMPVGTQGLLPLSVPISISGATPSAVASLQSALTPAGFTVTAGSASSGGSSYKPRPSTQRTVESNIAGEVGTVPAAPILPAAPIGAFLMRGDVNVTAIGTVTMVENDRVLAFGHPFLGFGHVDFPMATAAIINTLASPAGSYKQGAAAREVGSITHDRLTMIGGQLGAVAPMVPARVVIKAAGKKDSVSHYEIADDPMWLPLMLENAMASATSRRLGYEAGGTIDLSVKLKLKNGELEYTDSYAAPPPVQVTSYAARDAASSLSLLARNDMERAKVHGIEIEVTGTKRVELSELVDVWADQSSVSPGQTVTVTAKLRRFRGDLYTKKLSLRIPEAIASDKVTITIGGAVELDRLDEKTRGRRTPQDLNDLLTLLADRRPSRALYARVVMPEAGIQRRMESLPGLPPSMQATLRSDGISGVRTTKSALGPAGRVTTKDVISGSKKVVLRVLPASGEL